MCAGLWPGLACSEDAVWVGKEAKLNGCCAPGPRRYIEEEHLDESLRRHLPREEGKPIEKPAEANLRTKMCVPNLTDFAVFLSIVQGGSGAGGANMVSMLF